MNIVFIWQAKAKYTNQGAMTMANKNEQSKPTMKHICFVHTRIYPSSVVFDIVFVRSQIPFGLV